MCKTIYLTIKPLNRQRRVGLGVLTPPRPSDVSSMPGGGVRTPSPTFRFVGSLHLPPSDAHWDHEPKAQSPWSAGVLAGVLQLENLAGKDAGAPRFMEGGSFN